MCIYTIYTVYMYYIPYYIYNNLKNRNTIKKAQAKS